jgi:hemolysin III
MIGLAHNWGKVPKWLTMTLYITLGWFGAFLTFYLYPYYLNIGGVITLILGGIFYTVGGYIYTTETPTSHQLGFPGKFGFHEVWHVTVIAGAATHWALMYFYVLPYETANNAN